MAKMFYTLEETAAALSLSEEEIRQMATDGKLQQFRDRDKLMFKREQVDKLSNKSDAADVNDESSIPLAGSSITGDAVSLQDSSPGETGISIFDTGEFDLADPAAATQISDTGEMGLEIDASAASGSGLMDLANDDNDETNLGAVLLDASDAGTAFGSGLGSGLGDSAFSASGLGESALDASALGASAFAEATGMGIPAVNIENSDEPTAAPQVASLGGEGVDSGASGFAIGSLLIVTVALVALVYMALTAGNEAPNGLTAALTDGDMKALIYGGAAFVIALVIGAICGFIGKQAG